MAGTLRWHQRFEHYERAVDLVTEALAGGVEALNELEREGVVQRFEMTVELGWKTLRDYLVAEGVTIDPMTPREVVRAAFAARLIVDGQVWMDMLDHRNLLSHTYDAGTRDAALRALSERYLAAFVEVRQVLAAQRGEG